MRVSRLGSAVGVLGALLVSAARVAAQSGPIEQGVVAYQNLDYEASADLMRRALRAPAVSVEDQGRALSYLGAAEFFLGHREASLSAFRDMARLDARIRLDPLLFPPDVQRTFEEARRSVRIVQASVPADTEILIGTGELPFRLYASSTQTIVVTVARELEAERVTLYSGAITDSMDLTWDGRVAGGNPARSGAYALRIASLSGGRVGRTVRIPLQVTLERRDTLPLPRAPMPSQYLPERSVSRPLKGVIRGFAMGMLAIGLPAAMGADTRSMIGPLVVGGAISVSGLVGLMMHPNGQRVDSNVTYNQRLRDNWRQKVDSAAAENVRRRQDVRIVIRVGQPVVQEGAAP